MAISLCNGIWIWEHRDGYYHIYYGNDDTFKKIDAYSVEKLIEQFHNHVINWDQMINELLKIVKPLVRSWF